MLIVATPFNSCQYGFPPRQSYQVSNISGPFFELSTLLLSGYWHLLAAVMGLSSVFILGASFAFLLTGVGVLWISCPPLVWSLPSLEQISRTVTHQYPNPSSSWVQIEECRQ